MGNSAGISAKRETKKERNVVDVEQMILAWVKQKLGKTKGANHKLQLDEIKWNEVMIKNRLTIYSPLNNTGAGTVLNSGTAVNPSASAKTRPMQILHEASFENATSKEDNKAYQTEVSSESTASISLDDDIHFSPGFEIFAPDDIAKFSKMATFKVPGKVQNFARAEHASCKVDHPLHLRPWSKVHCQLVLIKLTEERSFRHTVDLSGELHVSVTVGKGLKQDLSGDVTTIFQDQPSFRPMNRGVQFEVKGRATFDYGIESKVLMTEEKLQGRIEPVEEKKQPAVAPYTISLGYALEGNRKSCKVMIPAGSPLPYEYIYPHNTVSSRYYRSRTKFWLYVGEHARYEYNDYIGELQLEKFEGVASDIQVKFRWEENYQLTVTATDGMNDRSDTLQLLLKAPEQ